MALYPYIDAIALNANESFENNFWKNGLIQAKLNSLNQKTENLHLLKWSANGQWMLGNMLQRMNPYGLRQCGHTLY